MNERSTANDEEALRRGIGECILIGAVFALAWPAWWAIAVSLLCMYGVILNVYLLIKDTP
jgi:hypothetical protein